MFKYRVIKRGRSKIVQDELNPLKWGINTLEDFVICSHVNAHGKNTRRRSIDNALS